MPYDKIQLYNLPVKRLLALLYSEQCYIVHVCCTSACVLNSVSIKASQEMSAT